MSKEQKWGKPHTVADAGFYALGMMWDSEEGIIPQFVHMQAAEEPDFRVVIMAGPFDSKASAQKWVYDDGNDPEYI
jgi:hypothetical protein